MGGFFSFPAPTPNPTPAPTPNPTPAPTFPPPTPFPTLFPTTNLPTLDPTFAPTLKPPTKQPTESPTIRPTLRPTTTSPTTSPTTLETLQPTKSPTLQPTTRPSTLEPTNAPTTSSPTLRPTIGGPLPAGLQAFCDENNIDFNVYNICLNLSVPEERVPFFIEARDKWTSINVGHQTAVLVPLNPDGSNRVVDDMFIDAEEEFIDGVGGVLGAAGPTFILSRTGLPVSGSMVFDSADVEVLASSNNNGARFYEVVLHEMGHIQGIGTRWDVPTITGPESPDGFGLIDNDGEYYGTRANGEWAALGCTTPFVPVETDTGLPGTDFGHWDEFCLGDELMTGFLSSDGSGPLSRLSIAALEDLGYTVDYSNADPFSSADINPSCCLAGSTRRNLGFFDGILSGINDFLQDLDNFDVPGLPPLTEKLLQVGRSEALRIMKRNREMMGNVAINPELEFVGGDSLTIFMFDEDGNIRHKDYTWDEVDDTEEGEISI